MKIETPNYLYKYRAVDSNSLAILKTKKIWYAQPGSFNDPYDCNISLCEKDFHQGWLTILAMKATHESNIKVLHSIITEPMALELWSKSQSSYKFLKDIMFKQLQSIGILSLSTRNDLMLLWSHYSDNHKGFCIELSMEAGSVLRNEAVPVIYSNEFPEITIDTIMKDPNSANSLWKSKSKEWEYEDEWRHMAMQGNMLHSLPGRISGIVFGCKMEGLHKIAVRDALIDISDVTYKQAVLMEGKYELVLVPA